MTPPEVEQLQVTLAVFGKLSVDPLATAVPLPSIRLYACWVIPDPASNTKTSKRPLMILSASFMLGCQARPASSPRSGQSPPERR